VFELCPAHRAASGNAVGVATNATYSIRPIGELKTFAMRWIRARVPLIPSLNSLAEMVNRTDWTIQGLRRLGRP